MLKVKFLRNILLLAIFIAGALPTYEMVFVQPSYRNLLLDETEDEATRYARYLIQTLRLDRIPLVSTAIPQEIAAEVGLQRIDPLLIKLRVFGPSGEIVFSTLATEIGTANDQPYFRGLVAKGQIYSKVVHRDERTAEGQRVKTDIVETYVPIMAGGRFVGAIETYHDLTLKQAQLDVLTRRSTWSLLAICTLFLVTVVLVLHKAHQSITAREGAEEALRQVNDQLEEKVRERTDQLVLANRLLTNEIAERTLAEQALAAALGDSEEVGAKLDGILASVDDGLLVTDGEDRIVLLNAAAESLLEVGSGVALGRRAAEVIRHPELRAKILAVLARGEAGQQFDFDLPAEGGGRLRVFQGRTFRFSGSAAGRGGLIILVQDVTREREVEQMKNEFLAMAAHELHTPLTTIVGYSELLSTAPDEAFPPEQQREFLGYMHQKALSLARIVDDLLDISRFEAGQPLPLRVTNFNLDEMLLRMVGQYREHGGAHRFELQLGDEPIEVHGDQGRIEQVLENLLSNAVKYSPGGGTIRVSAVTEGDGYCRLQVRDEGLGMTPEQLAKIFDRFYRVDTSDTATRGTGLGLSITRHLIEAHAGEINVASAPGIGTTVTVRLPLRSLEKLTQTLPAAERSDHDR